MCVGQELPYHTTNAGCACNPPHLLLLVCSALRLAILPQPLRLFGGSLRGGAQCLGGPSHDLFGLACCARTQPSTAQSKHFLWQLSSVLVPLPQAAGRAQAPAPPPDTAAAPPAGAAAPPAPWPPPPPPCGWRAHSGFAMQVRAGVKSGPLA